MPGSRAFDVAAGAPRTVGGWDIVGILAIEVRAGPFAFTGDD